MKLQMLSCEKPAKPESWRLFDIRSKILQAPSNSQLDSSNFNTELAHHDPGRIKDWSLETSDVNQILTTPNTCRPGCMEHFRRLLRPKLQGSITSPRDTNQPGNHGAIINLFTLNLIALGSRNVGSQPVGLTAYWKSLISRNGR